MNRSTKDISKIKDMIEEYKSITDDRIAVEINGKIYLDTELRSRKKELEMEIEDAAVFVIGKQIESANSCGLNSPYDDQFSVEYCDYKIININDTEITLKFVDIHYDLPTDYRATISFNTIINFNERAQLLDNLEDQISSIAYDIKRKNDEIIKLTEKKEEIINKRNKVMKNINYDLVE